MKNLKKFFNDDRIALIIRWWAVGAVYFFVGWGTDLAQKGIIDFVFFLGLSIGIFNILIVNPVLSIMFNLKSNTKYTDTSIGRKVMMRLIEIFKAILIVSMMVYIYGVINDLLIKILSLPSNSVPLPGEPISFGIIYIIILVIINKLGEKLKIINRLRK